jgi:hypothetical protein
MYREKLTEQEETIFFKVMINPLNRCRLVDAYRSGDPRKFVSTSSRLIKEASPEDSHPLGLPMVACALLEAVME